MNRSKNPRATDHRKKMTKEQLQLAIAKKKECEERALKIVYQLIEPKVDCTWLLENLKHISRCHMEDVIEERAITKICGYALCQKPLTFTIKQTYHISLKDKKVYDMTKRKNFCSSSCFAASNYLLEQMLTSPLWIREKEDIPEFQILSKTIQNNPKLTKSSFGEVDISVTRVIKESGEKKDSSFNQENEENINQSDVIAKQELSKEIDNFVFESMKYINTQKETSNENFESLQTIEPACNESKKESSNSSKNHDFQLKEKCEVLRVDKDQNIINPSLCDQFDEKKKNYSNSDCNILMQDNPKMYDSCEKLKTSVENCETFSQQNFISCKNYYEKADALKLCSEKTDQSKKNIKSSINSANEKKLNYVPKTKSQFDSNGKVKKLSSLEKNKLKEALNVNLTAKIEQNLKEWVTEETVQFLFGTDSFKKKVIENIEHQDKYVTLCEKLNKLQFQDEQEDAEILEKPTLKPLPHFEVLKEEGKKLELKVRAFFEGKDTFEAKVEPATEEETISERDAVLPLIESHTPQALRRKIFLEKLDKVLPELLKTLSGNDSHFRSICHDYTSCKSFVVKTLIRTFSLSPKNIIFKSVEWTLVGLVIIKMLSIVDTTLNNLLNTKQASMFISMILTSYQLDSNYLNFFIDSLNPNMNLR